MSKYAPTCTVIKPLQMFFAYLREDDNHKKKRSLQYYFFSQRKFSVMEESERSLVLLLVLSLLLCSSLDLHPRGKMKLVILRSETKCDSILFVTTLMVPFGFCVILRYEWKTFVLRWNAGIPYWSSRIQAFLHSQQVPQDDKMIENSARH